MDTDKLFDAASFALLRGDWFQARLYLDDLATRQDNFDDLGAYYHAPPHVEDRVREVNAMVSVNRLRRQAS